MDTSKQLKAYYIMRKDLNMTPAKLAVQVGHGTVTMVEWLTILHKDVFYDWVNNHEMKKIVLEVSSEEKLKNLYTRYALENHPNIKTTDTFEDLNSKYFSTDKVIAQIWDNGHTEFEGVTLSGIVIFTAKDLPSYLNRLRLYK